MLAPAGTTMRGIGGSTKDCLKIEARPSTPEEIRKYRRSTNLEPGKRFVHHGLSDDLRTMKLEDKVYGAMSDRGKNNAADLINHHQPTELQRINMRKSEQVYKSSTREMLGKTVDRHIILPSKFTEGQQPFGITGSASAEAAKDVIFPTMTEEVLKGEDIYIRSHGSYRPGEQKDRHYNWPVDPTTTRFGAKGDSIAFNGVSKNIADVLKPSEEYSNVLSAKKVEEFKSMSDTLGQARNLGQGSGSRPPDTIYGKPSGSSKNKKIYTAKEIMKGRYTSEDQLPDEDLGRSIMPGFRNISVEDRAYGCPSIRTDLPAGNRARRSLADSQNYGDDVPAKDLVNPPAFSDMALSPEAFAEPRTKQKLIQLFSKIGFDVDQDASDAIFAEASAGGSHASINAFRGALNEYLDAVDTRREGNWRRARGI